MAFPIAALIAGASALLSGAGKLKSQKAAQKKTEDEARLKFEANKRQFGQSEKRRISGTKQLQATAGARGIAGFENLPEEYFTEQEFSGAPPSKESGRSVFGDVLQGVGGIGQAAGDFMSQQDAASKHKQELDELMCAINPALCEKAGPPSDIISRG